MTYKTALIILIALQIVVLFALFNQFIIIAEKQTEIKSLKETIVEKDNINETLIKSYKAFLEDCKSQ